MKIAYIMYPDVLPSGKSNGIRSQAETWAKLLSDSGHIVDLVSEWKDYDWKSYDAIHLFGGGIWFCGLVTDLKKFNPKVFWSPIADPPLNYSYKKIKRNRVISKFLPFMESGWSSYIDSNQQAFTKVFVRSRCEQEYVHQVFQIPNERFALVPLSLSDYCQDYEPVEKEPFCLHISSIYQERKNVLRLIEAAKKYNFRLVLAGNKGNSEQFNVIEDAIGDAQNIEVLGFISERQKIDLYKRAKVFALPSLQEGVGIVALDAAYFGCEIVMTNIPGPKEYYDGKCVEVDPLSTDDIGKSVVKLLSGGVSYQPALKNKVNADYSPFTIGKILEVEYR